MPEHYPSIQPESFKNSNAVSCRQDHVLGVNARRAGGPLRRKATERDRFRGDRKKLARVGGEAILKMVFLDGFVHADLHP